MNKVADYIKNAGGFVKGLDNVKFDSEKGQFQNKKDIIAVVRDAVRSGFDTQVEVAIEKFTHQIVQHREWQITRGYKGTQYSLPLHGTLNLSFDAKKETFDAIVD